MSSLTSWAVYGALALGLAKLAHLLYVQHRLKKIMPPGPAGLPLLGNIFQLPKFQWLRFTEWKEQYGPIFSLNFAGQPVIVLNDFATSADLLDRKSSVYSDRPRFIMGSEILTGGMLIAFLTYGDRWRRMRRAGHEGFNTRAVTSYQPLQEKESTILLSHLLRDSTKWEDHVKRSAASAVLSAVYGWLPIDKDEDPLVQRINDIMHRMIMACLPGAYLVEFFPAMLHLPDWMAKWKREGKEWFRKDTELFEGFQRDVEVKMREGKAEPSFAASLIEGEKKFNLSKQESAWLAGTMFGAGAETTAAALSIFVLAMILHPDKMRRAQAQIDAVVGRERLPTFADRRRLPYVEAMVKEILRWRPVGPMGLPRRTSGDDWYKGYFIPKGSIVMYNVWAMNRDPKYFPDYDAFRPERFLHPDGQIADLVPDTHGLGHLTFGSGRRICIGKDLANQTLFIDFACILWAFDIVPPTGSDGKPIIPSIDDFVDEGLVVRPAPFKCSFVPRAPEVSSLIQATANVLAKEPR